MKNFFLSIQDFVKSKSPGTKFWIAYSGGLDSHVLLHVLAKLRELHALNLEAVHINHQLSINAAAWVQHCTMTCAQLNIPFISKKISISLNKKQSLEEAARLARYAIFSEMIQQDQYLLTAHHSDDQVETVLMQLFRGSGLKGLAGMPEVKRMGKGYHARPLLYYSRELLQKYAVKNQLIWIEDESNANLNHTRNYLRHQIIPLLKKRWPAVNTTIARAAQNCAKSHILLQQFIAEDLYSEKDKSKTDKPRKGNECLADNILNQASVKKIQEQILVIKAPAIKSKVNELTRNNQFISIPYLLEYSAAKQNLILREWLSLHNIRVPSVVKLEEIQKQFLYGGKDKSPFIAWDNIELRRYQDKIYLMQSLPLHDSQANFDWELSKPLNISNIGTLYANRITGKGLHSNLSTVRVRFRRGGEKCYISNGTAGNHKELKKLFQHWNVPPWERDRIPLLFFENVLLSVVGFYIDPRFVDEKEGYVIELK